PWQSTPAAFRSPPGMVGTESVASEPGFVSKNDMANLVAARFASRAFQKRGPLREAARAESTPSGRYFNFAGLKRWRQSPFLANRQTLPDGVPDIRFRLSLGLALTYALWYGGTLRNIHPVFIPVNDDR